MEKKVYAALIYNLMNILVAVEERPTYERAEKAGRFMTRHGGWYQVVDSDIDMYRCLINV